MTEDHDPTSDEPAPDDQPRSRPAVASVLAALCVLALVGGIVLFTWLRGETAEREDAEQDRIAAMQAAERFTITWNTFRPTEVESYVEDVSSLLSTKFATEFKNAAEDVALGIREQRLFSKGEVLVDGEGIPLVGVAALDGDSAEVLVVSDAKRVADGQRVLRHWRWQISLVEVDGEWLVDDFKEV